MLRPLAFIAVRKQQCQPARLAPLRFGSHQELVDHDLGAVHEIAELRFPHHQSQRIGHAVAKLKAEHGVLAERAVVDVEPRLILR